MELLHCLHLKQLILQIAAKLLLPAITTIFFFLLGNAIGLLKNPFQYFNLRKYTQLLNLKYQYAKYKQIYP